MHGSIPDISFRSVIEDDIKDLQSLYKECFPVSYPDSWFSYLTQNKSLITLAAVSHGHVIGILVAKFSILKECNPQDRGILDDCFPPFTSVAYIMSLGVTEVWRSQGIASRLLDAFVRYASGSHYLQHGAACSVPLVFPAETGVSRCRTSENLDGNHDNQVQHSPFASGGTMSSSSSSPPPATVYSSLSELLNLLPACPPTCCAIYLHVLRTNFHARRFYENRGFRRVHIQQGCYSIAGQPADGCTYVMHVNGGFAREPLLDQHPMWSRMLENIQYTWLPGPVTWFLQLAVRFGQAVLCRIYPTGSRPNSHYFLNQTNHVVVPQTPPRASLCQPAQPSVTS